MSTDETKEIVTEEQPKVANTYVTLMETNGKECESWLSFIKYQGNEKNIEHLKKQLETVDWYVIDELSVFEIDTEHPVSETTAKEMTKVDLNSCSFHRKFDGVLQPVDLGLRELKKKLKSHRKKSKEEINDLKIDHIFDILGYGRIDEFIDGEDLDPEDLATSNSDSDKQSESQSESESEKSESPEKKKMVDVPPALRPKFARHKNMRRKAKQ